MWQWLEILFRKKQLDESTISDTKLGRVLNTWDLTLLGVASTLGVGVYVLPGHVANDIAGPSVVLSFVIAGIASILAGLCYAEFGARVPKAGSAYIYSYVTIGEFIAFIIGWNLILEYVIGSASVAKGLTMYLDSLLDYKLNDTFNEIAKIPETYFMASYFDIFSFSVSFLLGIGMAFGLKESKWVNNIFTVINILVVIYVITAGAMLADVANWTIPAKNVPNNKGTGGFFPYSFKGTIKGAATCFYGFVGFDCIATTGEEVKNPKRAIPISIILSLFIVCVAYCGTATIVTLMLPYYEQDPDSPIPYAFDHLGQYTSKWIVAFGGIFGLLASLFGSMFPLPRIIYAMATDSLIFRFLGNVNKKFKTPVVGTILASLLTGLMSALFELKHLVNMMSIGTLLAYTIVAACVLLLRYTLDEEETATSQYSLLQQTDSDSEYEYNDYDDPPMNEGPSVFSTRGIQFKTIMSQMFNFTKTKPTKYTRKIIGGQVMIFCILAIGFGACIKFLIDDMTDITLWPIILTSVIGCLIVLVTFSMASQPSSNKELTFKVPWVPFIPALSIIVNIYLMFMLDSKTWIRFGVWMAIGLPIYFTSACCLYKTKQQKQYHIQNGIINFAYEKEETVQELTIPEIIIQPCTPDELVPVTKNTTSILRNNSKNSNDSKRNSSQITAKVVSKVDSDTESESSQEHHVQVEVHRAHEEEPNKNQTDLDFEALKDIDPRYIQIYFNFYEDDQKQSSSLPENVRKRLRTVSTETIKDYLQKSSEQTYLEVLKEINIEHINIYFKSKENNIQPNIPPEIKEKLDKINEDIIKEYLLNVKPTPKSDFEVLNEVSLEHIQIYLDSVENSTPESGLPKKIEQKLKPITVETIERYIDGECQIKYAKDMNILKEISLYHIQSYLETIENPNLVRDIPKKIKEKLRKINITTIRQYYEKENYSDEDLLEALNEIISQEEMRQLALEEGIIGETDDSVIQKDCEERKKKDLETGEYFKDKGVIKEDSNNNQVESRKSSTPNPPEIPNSSNEIMSILAPLLPTEDLPTPQNKDGKPPINISSPVLGRPDAPPLPDSDFLFSTPLSSQSPPKDLSAPPENQDINSSTLGIPKAPPIPDDFLLSTPKSPSGSPKDLSDLQNTDVSNVPTVPPLPPDGFLLLTHKSSNNPPKYQSLDLSTPITPNSSPKDLSTSQNEEKLLENKGISSSFDIPNVAPLPPPDFLTRKISTQSLEHEGNVKTGTQFEKIKHKLDNIFSKQNYVPLANFSTTVSEDIGQRKEERLEEPKVVTSEEIPENYAKSLDFKKKLGALILKNSFRGKGDLKVPNLTQNYQKKCIPIETTREGEEINIPKDIQKTLEGYQEDHKKKMIVTLKSIKLKKVSGLNDVYLDDKDKEKGKDNDHDKEDKDKEKEDKKTDEKQRNDRTSEETVLPKNVQINLQKEQEDHKKKMTATLRSIKLRKTGLSMSEDSKDDEQIELPKNVTKDLTKEKEEHKKKMIATLRSIKLRKTGLLEESR